MPIRKTGLIFLALSCASFSQVPDFTPPTPLFGAVSRNDATEVARLLAGGANPNEGQMLGASPLTVALMQRNPAAAMALMAKGADVKALDGAGSTTLMWAAASETGDAGIVNELLRRGVDPNAVNKMGENALQWAMRRGFTPATQALIRAQPEPLSVPW